MALEYGYTLDDLYGEGADENWNDLGGDDYARDRDWIGEADGSAGANRTFTPTHALQELDASKQKVDVNPYLNAEEERASLEALDREELKTDVIHPQKVYGGNGGFIGESKASSLNFGDYIARYEESDCSGSEGRYTPRTSLAPMGS